MRFGLIFAKAVQLYCIVDCKNQVRNNKKQSCLLTLETISMLAVGELTKPVAFLVDTPRCLQNINKQKKQVKQENPKTEDNNSPA